MNAFPARRIRLQEDGPKISGASQPFANATGMKAGYVVDFESRSPLDLGDVGADAYWHHPKTEILCIGYASTTSPNDRGCVAPPNNPERILDNIASGYFISFGDFDYIAWNAKFPDRAIPPERFVDLQVLAGAAGLPSDLDTVAKELNCQNKKDGAGHKLMLKMCKPDKKGEYFYSVEAYMQLMSYCLRDVAAELEVYQKLPGFSVASEEAVHALHVKINSYGILIDEPMARGGAALVESYISATAARVEHKYGISLTSRKQVMDYAASVGWPLPGYAKDDVELMLADDFLHPNIREILDARQLTAYASVKKYRSLLDRMGPGNRIRYSYKMNGAVRTGRFSAGGSQLHNFARGDKGLKKEREAIIDAISRMDVAALTRISGGRPMLAAATVLRNALIADPGHVLLAEDYSAIEARLVLWVAGARSLDLFRKSDAGEGPEPYRVYAGMIFGVDPKDVTPQQRAVGKETVLGSGFSMGPKKFMERLLFYGIPCDMTLAERCIKGTYRAQNPEVADWNTGAWRKIGDAALQAMRCRGAVIDANLAVPIKFMFDGATLLLRLPSGRKLFYRNAGINLNGKYGEELTYWTHGSEEGKQLGWHQTHTFPGKLYENTIQAISADLTRDAMLKISQRYPIRLHSHDEIVCSVPDSEVEEAKAFMKKCMCDGPEWAKGLPIAVAGWVDKRFIKD